MNGDGSVYLRGAIWWMKYYRNGRAICMSCKTRSEDLARRKLKSEMRKRDDELAEPRFARVTVGDLVRDVLLWWSVSGKDVMEKTSRRRWENHLAATFEHVKAAQFSSVLQHQYRKHRIDEGACNTTVDHEMQVLLKAFNLAYVSEPPKVKRVPKFFFAREDTTRRGFLNRTQMEALKLAAAKHSLGMRAIIEAAHMIGWRRGMLTNLRVHHVHLDRGSNGILRVEKTKNGDAAEAPLTPALRTYVEALLVGKKPDDLLFGIPDGSFRLKWEAVRDAAGLHDTLFHDLRRTSARSKRDGGMSTHVIMALHCWKTPAMFQRYGIVETSDLSTALEKQEAFEALPQQTGGNA
jgi:integrase